MLALIKLSRASGLYSQPIVRDDIQLFGTDAVAAGRFGDVWKGVYSKDELVAVKTLRIYKATDVNKLLKASDSIEIYSPLVAQVIHAACLCTFGLASPKTLDNRICLLRSRLGELRVHVVGKLQRRMLNFCT